MSVSPYLIRVILSTGLLGFLLVVTIPPHDRFPTLRWRGFKDVNDSSRLAPLMTTEETTTTAAAVAVAAAGATTTTTILVKEATETVSAPQSAPSAENQAATTFVSSLETEDLEKNEIVIQQQHQHQHQQPEQLQPVQEEEPVLVSILEGEPELEATLDQHLIKEKIAKESTSTTVKTINDDSDDSDNSTDEHDDEAEEEGGDYDDEEEGEDGEDYDEEYDDDDDDDEYDGDNYSTNDGNSTSEGDDDVVEADKTLDKAQFLLDFAIIGLPLTGNHILEHWLTSNYGEQVLLKSFANTSFLSGTEPKTILEGLFQLNDLQIDMDFNDSSTAGAALEESIINNFDANRTVGFIAPQDIMSEKSIDNMYYHFPKTKLIVGVRHPFDWFVDQVYHLNLTDDVENAAYLKFPHELSFHVHLSRFGKTSARGKIEHALLTTLEYPFPSLYPRMPNSVFLYDASQLTDSNVTRQAIFFRDLADFLGLPPPSQSLQLTQQQQQQLTNNNDMNLNLNSDFICSNRIFDKKRAKLLGTGKCASKWINRFFLNPKYHEEEVTLSSPDYFSQLLMSWRQDPCLVSSSSYSSSNSATIIEESDYSNLSSSSDSATIIEKSDYSSEIESDPCDEEIYKNISKADHYPPLNCLVVHSSKNVVKQDVQWMLDFAIIGHAKTATTTLMTWLAAHPEIMMFEKELHQLTKGNPVGFVETLYNFPRGSHFKRGYKAPNDVASKKARLAFHKFFKDTKLIVGLRHPIKWFESYYNFKNRQGKGQLLPPAEEMIGKKMPKQVKFHVHLAMMNKTEMDVSEMDLINPYVSYEDVRVRMRNPVFLYEVSQPFDRNETRNEAFRTDLSNYLGLSFKLRKLEMVDATNSLNYHYAIDICDDKYIELRANLLEIGRDASLWIQKYFLGLEKIHVSSRDRFLELLNTWDTDPCVKN